MKERVVSIRTMPRHQWNWDGFALPAPYLNFAMAMRLLRQPHEHVSHRQFLGHYRSWVERSQRRCADSIAMRSVRTRSGCSMRGRGPHARRRAGDRLDRPYQRRRPARAPNATKCTRRSGPSCTNRRFRRRNAGFERVGNRFPFLWSD